MADSALDPERFLDRWHGLSGTDRKTIFEQLPESRQRQLQDVIRQAEAARAAEAALDRQYAAYSPWLGQLIEAADGSDAASSSALDRIKPQVREALARAHRATVPMSADAANESLGSRLRRAFESWLGHS